MDERWISFIYHFNVKKDYFECHELGESLWLDTGRPIVLKGMIQAAVCLYHFENGNVKGATSMWFRARDYLTPYLPRYEGVDLERLIHDLDDYFAHIPYALYDRQLSATDLAAIKVPVVTLTIYDEELYRIVQSYLPSEEHEE